MICDINDVKLVKLILQNLKYDTKGTRKMVKSMIHLLWKGNYAYRAGSRCRSYYSTIVRYWRLTLTHLFRSRSNHCLNSYQRFNYLCSDATFLHRMLRQKFTTDNIAGMNEHFCTSYSTNHVETFFSITFFFTRFKF